MPTPLPTAPRRRRTVALAALLVVLVTAAACAPTTPSPTTTSTTTTLPPGQQVLCKIWDQRTHVDDQGNPVAPTPPFIYELDDETVVHAREVSQTGKDCTDPAARLRFQQGEIVGKDLYYPPHNHLDGPQFATTAYSLTLAEGQVQTPSVEIASFNIELSTQGIRIYGTLRVTINGVASIVSFDGRFQDLENFSVRLDAPSLQLPGLASRPVSASGSLERRAGENSLRFDAEVPELQVGDIGLERVALHLSATTTTGLQASVQGTARTAGSTATLALSVDFDAAGQLRQVDGAFDLSLSSYASNGDLVQLDGRVRLSGQASALQASFSGSGRIGSDTITNASGSVRIEPGGVVRLDGVFEADRGGSSLRLEGSLVFDGSQAYPSLQAIAAGAFTGVTAQGEIVEIRGTVTVSNPGGVLTTTVDGALRVGALRGTAHAQVVTNGATTTLQVSGRIASGDIDADVGGTIVFAGTSVESVDLSGRLRRAATVGEVTATGQVRVTGGPNGWQAQIDGRFQGTGVDVSGGASLVVDPNGDLVSLRAGVTGSLSDGRWGVGGFAGSLVADPSTAVLTGRGTVIGSHVNYGVASGSLVVSGGVATLQFQGQVSITSGSKSVYGDVTIADGELRMARVGIVYPPILIDPERVWVRLSLGDGGKCVNFQVLEATFLIGLFTGGQIARADLECPA